MTSRKIDLSSWEILYSQATDSVVKKRAHESSPLHCAEL
jgi:hypothetical protein